MRSMPALVAAAWLVLPPDLARGAGTDGPEAAGRSTEAPAAGAPSGAAPFAGTPPAEALPAGAGRQAGAAPCGSSEGIEAGPRLSAWMEKRKEKCGRLSPYEPTFVERQMLAFEKAERPSILQLNFAGFYPRFQTIDHRSQSAFGLRYWRPDLGGSRFDLNGSAFWSIQGFRYYEAQAGVVPHRGKAFPLFALKADDVFELENVRQDDDTPYMLYASFSRRWAPKFDFFGIGPGSRAEDRSDFRQQDTLVEGVAGYRVLPKLTVIGRLGFYTADIGPGTDEDLPQLEDVFDPATIPGFERQPDFLRYGLNAIFDGRDVPKNPHRGGLLAVQWKRFAERGGSANSFSRYAVDGRVYLALGHPQRVLALRVYASRDDPAAGARVPFYLQSWLGSSHTLRAHVSQRFRGEKLALFQAEYRWEASPSIELAAFVDTGTVAARAEDGFEDFRTDRGIGLRIKTHELTALRFDCAWGDEGFRLLFRFGASF